jgi:hypothetical protein
LADARGRSTFLNEGAKQLAMLFKGGATRLAATYYAGFPGLLWDLRDFGHRRFRQPTFLNSVSVSLEHFSKY